MNFVCNSSYLKLSGHGLCLEITALSYKWYSILHYRDISDEFIFGSEHGILSNWYPSGELMPFKGSVPFPYNKDHSKLLTITHIEKLAVKRITRYSVIA